MKIHIPDDIVARAETNAIEIRIALAVQFYADNRLDHADACALADLSPSAFNQELLSRAVSIQQYPDAIHLRARRSA